MDESALTSGFDFLKDMRMEATCTATWGSPLLLVCGSSPQIISLTCAGTFQRFQPGFLRAAHGLHSYFISVHPWFSKGGDPRDLSGDPPATTIFTIVPRCHSLRSHFFTNVQSDSFQQPQPTLAADGMCACAFVCFKISHL